MQRSLGVSARRRGRVIAVAVLVGGAVGAGAPGARAAEEVAVYRYGATHEVGIGLSHGGLYAATRSWPVAGIPAWATSATVEVVDDRGAPVAGRLDVYAPDVPSWAQRRATAGYTMCSERPRTVPVPGAGTLDLRIIAGAFIDPESTSDPCALSASAPTSGSVTVTFHR